MDFRLLKVTCPARIDLAGGTLDVYPLYVFEDGGVTVNAAIELRSKVWMEKRKDKKIFIRSKDLRVKTMARNIRSLKPSGPLSLVARAVRFYQPKSGLNITTRNEAPKGSGLGASSSLLIALSCALNEICQSRLTKTKIIDVAANIEAQEIGIPTGKQDYYAAMYGGINALWFGLEKNVREPLGNSDLIRKIEKSCVLSFTGISHFSGATNWDMLKAYIEKKGKTVQHMKAITATALAVHDALKKQNLSRLAKLVGQEWQNRKALAKGVTTSKVEKLMSAAKKAGAISSKLCGAGGGGCMITFCKPDDMDSVKMALTLAGADIMPLRISTQGVEMEYINNK